MTARVQERAHAKINLNLSIHGRRPDGYHELSSLVAFAADIYDVVTLSPADGFALDVGGAFGHKLSGDGNLIETANQLAQQLLPDLQSGQFHLVKSIPIASGVGGGSADAAAALRALAKINGLGAEPEAFRKLAPRIGADVPVCLSGQGHRAAFMQGIGEKVFRHCEGDFWRDGDVHAVLVNPRIEVSTADVFRSLNAPMLSEFTDVAPPEPFSDVASLVAYLQTTKNDMQSAAVALAPVIGDVLQSLEGMPHCLLARMSGSGATCFGLFATADNADQARLLLEAQSNGWWIAATRLV